MGSARRTGSIKKLLIPEFIAIEKKLVLRSSIIESSGKYPCHSQPGRIIMCFYYLNVPYTVFISY
jgi:hypothetical protein